MAAAEARAVWQRTANRCFVQEDAKRAPKLACCQSSSSTSKVIDVGPASPVDRPDNSALDFMPLKQNLSFSNLPPDTKWWLQWQPNYDYHKEFTPEELNALEREVENFRAGNDDERHVFDEVHLQKKEDIGCNEVHNNHDPFIHVNYGVPSDIMSKSSEVGKQETFNKNTELKDMGGSFERVEMDLVGIPFSKQSNDFCLDPEWPWMGDEKAKKWCTADKNELISFVMQNSISHSEKSEPWWRKTDGEELASLVMQKSVNHFENCDLPPPQNNNVRIYRYASIGNENMVMNSLDWKNESSDLPKLIAHAQEYQVYGSGLGKQGTSIKERHFHQVSDKSSSYIATHDDVMNKHQVFEDVEKVELMEALCHSQTRAREAEEAAKEAYLEKEHILKLFFKQASQLFAYKQWFRLLQLETLYIESKNKDQPISTLSPGLPWMSYKSRKQQRKRWGKISEGKRGKQNQSKTDLATCLVAFALGLSLIGTGLLLGWTAGWMLPDF